MTIAMCPGSFDPPTNGHIDVVERSSRHFEKVIVAIVVNPSKEPLFDHNERVELAQKVLGHLKNVEVMSHEGLLVDLARDRGAKVFVKGLRALSDVEYELQMAQMNAKLSSEIDTLFVATEPKWSFVSSSLVKEVARLGGDVSEMVPDVVNVALKARFGKGN